MNWILGVILTFVILTLGLIRLAFEGGPDAAISAETAWNLRTCLGPAKDIAVNTTITLLPPDGNVAMIAPKPTDRLEFVASGPVQVELTDDAGRNAIQSGGTYTLPDPRTLTISKGKGDFEFVLKESTMIAHAADAQFVVTTRAPLRFGPAENTTYQVRFDKDLKIASKVDGDRKVAILPAGASGTVSVGSGQALVPLQPVPVFPWLYDTKPTLQPITAVGRQGLSDLTIEAVQPGLHFDNAGFQLTACGRSSAEPKIWRPVGVADIKAQGAGTATVRLSVPSVLLPVFSRVFSPQIDVAIASLDGQYRAYGGFTAVVRVVAALIATALVLVVFAWLTTLRGGELTTEFKKMAAALKGADRQSMAAAAVDVDAGHNKRKLWFSSLFIGGDKEPSLSLFQVFFWTVITVWGLVYVYIVTGTLLTMTASMMVLLGISGTGSVLARWIAPTDAPAAVGTNAAPSRVPRPFEFWQILSTNGSFDLLKLQLFVFTLMIGIYVVSRLADGATFPDLDTNTLLLLGVSQGVYIGGKLAGTTALSKAQQLKLDLDLRTQERDKLVADKKKLTDERDSLTARTTTAGATPLTSDEQARLSALPNLISGVQAKIDDADKRINVLKDDYAAALKQLGLTPS